MELTDDMTEEEFNQAIEDMGSPEPPEDSTNSKKSNWKIEFAPLNVPFERRMQTLAVMVWVSFWLVIIPTGLILPIYLFFYTNYWYVAVIYLTWIYIDRKTCDKGSRSSPRFRGLKLWRYYRDYFPVKLVKTAELDPKKNYLLASHPHGILSSGSFACWVTESLDASKLFSGFSIHFLTLRMILLLPLIRELGLAFGLCSVTPESINYLLRYPGGGKLAIILPGGSKESLDCAPGAYVLKLKDRKGFVKLALQSGVSLVPVFCFGESDIYDQVVFPEGSFLRTLQNKYIKLFNVAPALINGRGIFQYSFGALPRRSPLVNVVGAPLKARRLANPMQEDIDAMHQEYMEALSKLFYDNREKFGKVTDELKFV